MKYLYIFLTTFWIVSSNALSLGSSDRPRAIVCGGGPVGLATAIVLANKPHCFNVTVFEASKDSSVLTDPTKAFLYNINWRGIKLTSILPGVTEKLEARAVLSTETEFNIVESDPSIPFKISSPPISQRSYWIPRHDIIAILQQTIKEHEYNRTHNSSHDDVGAIYLKEGVTVLDLEPNDEKGCVQVKVQGLDPKEQGVSYHYAPLIIGCDGTNSIVRTSLSSSLFSTKWNTKPKSFQMKKYQSPATGLRFKSLKLPPRFTVQDENGDKIPSSCKHFVIVRGKDKSCNKFLSLGAFPRQNDSTERSANCITRPDHHLWTLKNGKDVKNWFLENFSRIPFNDLVSDEEWDRFAKAQGTTFPYCQYAPRLQASSPSKYCGVLLLGDAAHAFPPDIGQGINMGFQDVLCMNQVLKEKNKKMIGKSLEYYEKIRSPETRAIIHIARFGSPYQYNQSHRIDRLRKKLWMSNVVLRLLLNKISFGIFPKQLMMTLYGEKELSYRQVARSCGVATSVLLVALSLLCMNALRFLTT